MNLKRAVRIITIAILGIFTGISGLMAQETGFTLNGKVLESGSGEPLQQAVVSIASSGKFTTSGEDGSFSIDLPSENEKLLVNLPGYHTLETYSHGRMEMLLYLTARGEVSSDEVYFSPFGRESLKEATNSVTVLARSDIEHSAATSSDQSLKGKVPGLYMIEHSGMPGHSSWMNMRGVSSIFARSEPLVFVDGMIHEISFPNNYVLEGKLLNPMDVVDVEDIVDISTLRVEEGQLGSAGSTGILNINTEQKDETSASIQVKMYGGIALAPKTLDVLNADQFKTYFTNLLGTQGYDNTAINAMYPWLNGENTVSEYYRYNNNTDWQQEIFKPAALQKYYLFLKGGDDIATYNISSGFLRHGGTLDKYRYSRYNLRLNGQINITNKVTITPHTKISLSDAYLTNNGPTVQRNPITSALLKSPLMHPNERSVDGTILFPIDDVGAFNVTNPLALVENGNEDYERNFQLLTSVKVDVEITPELTFSNVVGTSVNNDRVNVFIPDNGVVQIDSARNSPQDMVTEFRSFQNHTTINYMKSLSGDQVLNLKAGARVMGNTYKNTIGIDLNTPSDDFTSLGQGAEYEYLKRSTGELSELKWVSYFGNFAYHISDKYYLRASLSYDGSSSFNQQNRYNFYPSVFGAWRLSSMDFLKNATWLNDMKLRASWSNTGNMFSNIYNQSKFTYTGRRYNNIGVSVLDYTPNEDLEAEKKSTINTGVDISIAKRAVNIHVDYYMSSVNNLIINQQLPYNFGFTNYYDNGGALSLSGIEVGADARFFLGNSSLLLQATVTKQNNEVTALNFIDPGTEFLTREVFGAEYVTAVGNPVNSFYGYRALGVYTSDADAAGVTGPNGRPMHGGDVIFEDIDDNQIINDADKQIIGDPNPDLFGSFSAALKVNRLEFSALLTYSLGNDIYNYVRHQATSMDSYANQSTLVLDRWTDTNTGSDIPRASIGDPTGNTVFSDRYIEDGSYLRLSQLKVSYLTSSFFGLNKEAVIYLTGTNLLTMTNYSGYDPETMLLNDPYFMGIDYGRIPHARSVIIGIQLSL